MCCYLFSIIAKKVKQIKNNLICVVARLVFVFCCALLLCRCNAFQHIFVNQKKSEFYGPYFQTMLFLVTMVSAQCRTLKNQKFWEKIGRMRMTLLNYLLVKLKNLIFKFAAHHTSLDFFLLH